MLKPASIKKEDALRAWRAMPEGQPINKHVQIIPYKAEGSKYGSTGIRIDGNPEFIDAVLSRIKDLIQFENGTTRLELSRREVTGTEIKGKKKTFHNATSRAEVCYIRVHARGSEAIIMNTAYGMSAPRPRAEKQTEVLF